MPSPILPFKSFGPSSTPMRPSVSAGPGGRAQNLSVSRLNQQKERDASAVSMSQVLARKAGQENSRSTSVAHIGQTMSAPSTSISHPGSSVPLNGGDGQSDPGADNRRYAYMRKQILARQAKEAASARESASGKGLHVGTGAGMKTSGVGGLHKELGKEFRGHRSTYGSLTGTEKAVLEKSIAKRLGSKTTGSSVSSYDKRAIKSDISKAHSSGGVSAGHAKILKKIVGKL